MARATLGHARMEFTLLMRRQTADIGLGTILYEAPMMICWQLPLLSAS